MRRNWRWRTEGAARRTQRRQTVNAAGTMGRVVIMAPLLCAALTGRAPARRAGVKARGRMETNNKRNKPVQPIQNRWARRVTPANKVKLSQNRAQARTKPTANGSARHASAGRAASFNNKRARINRHTQRARQRGVYQRNKARITNQRANQSCWESGTPWAGAAPQTAIRTNSNNVGCAPHRKRHAHG